jgi:hypothetical protein
LQHVPDFASDTTVLTVRCCRAAASFNLKKMLVVDSASGLVRVCLANKQHQWDAVPPDPQPGALSQILLSPGVLWFGRSHSHNASRIQHQVTSAPVAEHGMDVHSTIKQHTRLCIGCRCALQHPAVDSFSSKLTSVLPAPAGARDGMLRWFEEYARRLQEGVYGVSLQPKTHMDLGVPPTLAIDLYPLKPPVRLSCNARRYIVPSVLHKP